MPDLITQVVADLERHEGFRKYAYPDPLSYLGTKYRSLPWGKQPARTLMALVKEQDDRKGAPWTVGFGDTVGVGPDTIVTLIAARAKLSNHIGKNLRELGQLIPSWQIQPFPIQTVLVNLIYNLGKEGLGKFKNTLSYITARNYPAAAANLEKSKWYGQVGYRAQELVKRVRTNSIDPKHLVP